MAWLAFRSNLCRLKPADPVSESEHTSQGVGTGRRPTGMQTYIYAMSGHENRLPLSNMMYRY